MHTLISSMHTGDDYSNHTSIASFLSYLYRSVPVVATPTVSTAPVSSSATISSSTTISSTTKSATSTIMTVAIVAIVVTTTTTTISTTISSTAATAAIAVLATSISAMPAAERWLLKMPTTYRACKLCEFIGHLLSVVPKESNKLSREALVLFGMKKSVGRALPACPCGPANSVHIVFQILWHLEVDHLCNCTDVQTARSHVSSHEYL
mmetsp:Transcript_21568/g.35595  ORF Transcript_21568/g.35595 Transcript_21568/m.35595 type:complete len:208 (+) Transcript_21568:146-769(+)